MACRSFGNVGYPTAERAIRGSTNIEILSDEDQELLRVACKVILPSFYKQQKCMHTNTHTHTGGRVHLHLIDDLTDRMCDI